jgi:hypothetical protein
MSEFNVMLALAAVLAAGTGATIGSVTPVGIIPGLIIGGVGSAVIDAATTPFAP